MSSPGQEQMMRMGRIAFFLGAFAVAGTGQAVSGPATPTQTTSGQPLNWVRYTDNAEGAFSMEVPVGWQILGGMYRFGYLDVRWMMNARSLDGKVVIRIDDPNVPPYVLPGPHSGPAGHAAIRPQLYQMVVDNFREAQPFAESYAKQRFASTCQSLTPREPDWTPAMPAAWQIDGRARSTQASIAYDCPTADGPRIAEIFARTTIVGDQGLWVADPIISILVAPDRLEVARSAVQHMIESWQVNPQWKQYQDRMTEVGLNVMRGEFQDFMRQMQVFHEQREAAMNQQVAHYYAQQNRQSQQVSNFCETLTGLTTVRDSRTGTEFQVFSGPKSNYYRNGLGVTVNSNISPGPAFYQVDEVQH